MEMSKKEDLAEHGGKSQWTEKRIEQLKELSQDPEIYQKLTDSLAPSIWELENCKKGILCMLFGGNMRVKKGRVSRQNQNTQQEQTSWMDEEDEEEETSDPKKAKLNKRWGDWNAVPALLSRSGALVTLIAAFGPKDLDERPAATRWMARYTIETFLKRCLAVHQTRMQTLGPDLLQPQLSVNLAKFTREIFKVWPKRRVGSVDMIKP